MRNGDDAFHNGDFSGNMTIKAWQNEAVSMEAAEIDTQAPFHSVKDAISLFRDTNSLKTTFVSKRSATEKSVLEKETQHLMMSREVDYYKQQLKNTQMEKSQALQQLHKANSTFQELTNKLEKISESRQASIIAAEAMKNRCKELELERAMRPHQLENQKQLHKICKAKLISAKQEIENLRKNFDAAMEEKLALLRKTEQVMLSSREQFERRRKLSEEVAEVREKLDWDKIEVEKAKNEHEKAMAEKEACISSRKSAMEEAETRIKKLREELECEEHLDEKIHRVDEEIISVKKELNEVRAKDLHSLEIAVSELENCKKSAEQVLIEENSLRCSLRSAEEELLEVKQQRLEAEKSAMEVESVLEKMQTDLLNLKDELQSAMMPFLSKILAETRDSQAEAADANKKAEVLKMEAQAARMEAEDAENQLTIALTEAKFAKNRSDEAKAKLAESKMITISIDAFNSMKARIEECKSEANNREEAARSEAEAIRARVKVILEKTEIITKENESLTVEISNVAKKTEMAEAAKRAVETELQKWRSNEKKEAEAKVIS